ncbi:MAG TPA: DUF5808 domain-containing protein [bacterium]|nr:DUF5808 domain-containing protein [bacterium]HPP87363.1 DUF5808 domain-containing protein [bacterium]
MKEYHFLLYNLFYANKNDERLVVPKKFGLGWTINFCHPKANLCLFITMTLILILIFLITIILNYSYLQQNSNVFIWYFLSIFFSLIVFSFVFLKFNADIKDIYIVMSYGILACFIGFGFQQIFNGIPILIIKMKNIKWYYHIYFAAMAAVCQTFGKFAVILLLMKLYDSKNTIIKFGLLVGLGFTITEISLITVTIIFNKLPFSSISYLGIFERTAASIFHIYTAGLIAFGLIKRTYKYLILIIILHSLLDFLAGTYRHFNIPVNTLEIIVFAISFFILVIFAFTLKNTYKI